MDKKEIPSNNTIIWPRNNKQTKKIIRQFGDQTKPEVENNYLSSARKIFHIFWSNITLFSEIFNFFAECGDTANGSAMCHTQVTTMYQNRESTKSCLGMPNPRILK